MPDLLIDGEYEVVDIKYRPPTAYEIEVERQKHTRHTTAFRANKNNSAYKDALERMMREAYGWSYRR